VQYLGRSMSALHLIAAYPSMPAFAAGTTTCAQAKGVSVNLDPRGS
jgi:hypothetical protein